MKSAKIYRVSLGDMGNIGFVTCMDEKKNLIGFFVSGQLPDRTNPPAGVYQVQWANSTPNHPNGVFVLQDVPGHTSVEIHQGNFFGDTSKGYKSDVLGCSLVADTVGLITLENGKGQVIIQNSMYSLNRFNNLMGPDTFSLEIIDGGSLLNPA